MANPTGIGGQKSGEPGRNPNGRPSGRQGFVDRAKFLLEEHNISDIKAFMLDEKKFDKLSVYDGIIMRRIAEAYSADGRQSMDSLLDRLIGKPVQFVKSENKDIVTVTLDERKKAAAKEADELLKSAAEKRKKK